MSFTVSADNLAIPSLVEDAGASAGLASDNTNAIRCALASGLNVRLPAGDFCVSGGFPHSVLSQKLVGAGQRQTRLHIADDFDTSTIAFSKLMPGCSIEGVGFYFRQPMHAGVKRSDLVKYPFAISSDDANNTIIRDIMIMGGFDGISMRGSANGNCGTTILSDISLGAFHRGLWLDVVRDTIYATNIHHYPFGATETGAFNGDLIRIFQDGCAEAIRCGLVEDLKIDNMLCSGSRIIFDTSPLGPSSASLLNVTLDSTNAGLDIFDGAITATNLKKSRGAPDLGIRVYGGSFNVGVFTMEGHEQEQAEALLTVNGGYVSIDNGIVGQLGPISNAIRQNGGELRVSDSRFDVGLNQVRPAPVIKIAGGRVRLDNNTAKDSGSGAKNFIEINNNERHYVVGNDAPGWVHCCVSTAGTSAGLYLNNRT